MLSKKKLEKISKNFDKEKTKLGKKFYVDMWKDDGDLPNPFSVVREFIMEKGLKLYGGQALHEHLNKYKKGLYTKDEFPDYDVFSPDAWNHAKQLADKLFKLGFTYVEARSSILNDEQHQTFKVSVDMLYIFDITQVGCTRKELANKNCETCGLSKDKKCISIFNHIPCNNILNYKTKGINKSFKETYDYNNDCALYPKRLFVTDPNWLKISMYRELSEPLSNPARLTKVAPRLDSFSKTFKYNHKLCKQDVYENEIKEQFLPILKHVADFVKEKKLVNYGATAFNFFLKGSKYKGNVNVSDYQVYSDKPIAERNMLLQSLIKKFPDFKFKTEDRKVYWKEIDTDDYIINVSKGRIKHNNIIKFTHNLTCMPYVQSKGVRYVTVDRLKYQLYRAVTLNEVTKMTEERPENYECILSHIIKNEKSYTKKYPRSNRHKFKRFISKCKGDEFSKIYNNLLDRWINKNETLKKTKFLIDHPKEGMITKIYPKPKEDLYLPYKPDENLKKKVKHMKTKKRSVKGRAMNTVHRDLGLTVRNFDME